MLALKKQEIERRVKALPLEVAGWVACTGALGGNNTEARDRYANAHYSQVQAVKKVVDELLQPQQAHVTALNVDGNGEDFAAQAFEITRAVIAAQTYWDFFRDKFDLRFSPLFADALWVADTAAWDCYEAVMQEAKWLGVLAKDSMREPPLTYLAAGFSPLTWVRSSRPYEDGKWLLARQLPFAIIELTWDSMQNLWELMALHHEVGHNVEHDLQLKEPLLDAMDKELKNAGVSDERRAIWLNWEGEVVADLIGMQLGGPAYAMALASLVLLPKEAVMTYNPKDVHPTHFVRIRMCALYIKTLLLPDAAAGLKTELEQTAAALDAQWTAIYGDGAGTSFGPLLGEFDVVARAVMQTPLPALKNNPLRSLMPYTKEDHTQIKEMSTYLRADLGANPPATIKPRHIISAARLAVHGTVPTAEQCKEINRRSILMMQRHAPVGVRAADRPKPSKTLAKELLALPITLQNTTL